eukprot:25500_1
MATTHALGIDIVPEIQNLNDADKLDDVSNIIMDNTQKPRPLPVWIVLWLLFAMFSLLFDVIFVLSRPQSFNWDFFAGYNKIYVKVDHIYGELHNGFLVAAAWMNMIEITLYNTALYFNLKYNLMMSQSIAFIVILMTTYKTFWYMLADIVGGENGFENTGHNTWAAYVFLYAIPNGMWIVIPFVILWYLFKKLFLLHKLPV